MRQKFSYPSQWVKGWSFYSTGAAGGGDDPPPPPPPPTPPPPPPPPGTPPKTFTQEDVNRMLAEDRRKNAGKTTELTRQLEQLQSSERLTKEEKEQLAAQIEDLKNQSLTKEQQLTRDLEKERTIVKTTTETLTKERDAWQTRYGTLLVTNAITRAAAENDAYSTSQLLEILSSRAKVVEKKGDDGKGNGEFEVFIKFDDTDAKTKLPIVIDLTPEQTVKRMKELPERFGNLFKSGVQGGVGKTKTGGTTGEPDYSKMTPEEYREHRKTRKL